jgi:hypothetical protein
MGLSESDPRATCLRCRAVSPLFRDVLEANVTDFCYRSAVFEEFADRKSLILIWLPPRDSNPDMLIQRQGFNDSSRFRRCPRMSCILLSFQYFESTSGTFVTMPASR